MGPVPLGRVASPAGHSTGAVRTVSVSGDEAAADTEGVLGDGAAGGAAAAGGGAAGVLGDLRAGDLALRVDIYVLKVSRQVDDA